MGSKKELVVCIFIMLLLFGFTCAEENLALLEKGGRAVLNESRTNQGILDSVFGAEMPNGRMFVCEIRRLPEGSKPSIDRIWDKKVKVNRIELRTTGAERAYEYKFYYWNLSGKKWEEIIHVTGNQNTKPVHVLEEPIITNQLRYECTKAGADGTGNNHAIYEINYYGEFVEGVSPNEPVNCKVSVHPTGFLQVVWETPAPNKDGELPVGYNIYRGNTEDFLPSAGNLVASNIKGNIWVDISAKADNIFYYSIESVGEFGEKSNFVRAIRSE